MASPSADRATPRSSGIWIVELNVAGAPSVVVPQSAATYSGRPCLCRANLRLD